MSTRLIMMTAMALCVALAACNTVRGVGQDIESAANAVDEET